MDDLFRVGEADPDRIARWIVNARAELAALTPDQFRRAAEIVAAMEEPNSFCWGQMRLRSLGCAWVSLIVGPDRMALVKAMKSEQMKDAA